MGAKDHFLFIDYVKSNHSENLMEMYFTPNQRINTSDRFEHMLYSDGEIVTLSCELCQLLQVQRTTEVFSHVDTSVFSSPVPHFTVFKVSAPKPETNGEVRKAAFGT